MKTYEEQLEQALERRGLRPNTRISYRRVVRQLTEHYDGQHPATLGTKQIAAVLVPNLLGLLLLPKIREAARLRDDLGDGEP